MKQENLDAMLAGYIRCALWSSTDNTDESGGEPLDANYRAEDLESDTIAYMRTECSSFLEAHAGDIGVNYGQAGHDLWLTRNGHGTGFWDRDGVWPYDGRRLAEAAQALGECCLLLSDEGTIFLEPMTRGS